MTDHDTLESFRESIDNIDAALVFMLAERFKITQRVGAYKATAGLPPADPGRERRQIERLRELARAARLDPEFSEKFLRFIIDEVIRHHSRIARGDDQSARGDDQSARGDDQSARGDDEGPEDAAAE